MDSTAKGVVVMLTSTRRRVFVIEILDRQHATWQGVVTLVANGEKKTFRSALDLLKIVDTALDEGGTDDAMAPALRPELP